MTETLAAFLWRLSEGGVPAVLPGNLAKDHFGPAFDTFLGCRIIVEKAPITEWSTCDSCECSLGQRPIQAVGRRLVATCPMDAARDTLLDAGDTRQFDIDIGRLIAETAAQSGFKSPEMVTDAVWHLSAMASGALFAIPSIAGWRMPGLMQNLRAWARGSPMLVVGAPCPESERQRISEAGVHWLAAQDVLPLSDPKRPLALDLNRLRLSIAADPRLVLNKAEQSVTIDGNVCKLSPQLFSLLEVLAESASSDGRVVLRRDIEERLWGNRAPRKTSIGEAIRSLKDLLDRCRQKKTPELITNRHAQGYQLELPATAIRIIE